MNVKGRILALKLLEKQKQYPELPKKTGVEINFIKKEKENEKMCS